MINQTVFLMGAIAFIVLAFYHLVGLPLARDIKFFLPIRVAVGLSPVMILLGLQQLMLNPETNIYVAGTLVLAYIAVLSLALRLLLPKPASTADDKDVVPQWFSEPDDDRFRHG